MVVQSWDGPSANTVARFLENCFSPECVMSDLSDLGDSLKAQQMLTIWDGRSYVNLLNACCANEPGATILAQVPLCRMCHRCYVRVGVCVSWWLRFPAVSVVTKAAAALQGPSLCVYLPGVTLTGEELVALLQPNCKKVFERVTVPVVFVGFTITVCTPLGPGAVHAWPSPCGSTGGVFAHSSIQRRFAVML